MRKNKVVLSVSLLIIIFQSFAVSAGEARVVASDAQSVTVEVNGLDYSLVPVSVKAKTYQVLSLPGGVMLPDAGSPGVPVVGTLLGMPFGTVPRIEVLASDYLEVNDVSLLPVPSVGMTQAEEYVEDSEAYGTDNWFPGDTAMITRESTIRDQRVAGVSLRPIQYNPVQRRLRIATRLRVRVFFERTAGTLPGLGRQGGLDSAFAPIYKVSILNSEQSAGWRSRQRRASLAKEGAFWYSPSDDWFRIPIFEDGLYVLDSDWFDRSDIPVVGADLSRLQIFAKGSEIPLVVEDGGDGQLDAGDQVLFWGAFRREADRDMESRFGRKRTYWLRFGTVAGKRYSSSDAAPTDASPAPWVMHTIHSEIDSVYERLGEAPDVDRDHWYYKRTASPSSATGQEFPVTTKVSLPDLAPGSGVNASIRVGMHGISLRDDIAFDHRTRIEIQDGVPVTEDLWDGQTAFIAEGSVDASALTDTVAVTIRTPGSPEFPFLPVPYVDHVRLNWTTITYPRLTQAVGGQFLFSVDTDSDFLITEHRASPEIILNLTTATRLSGAQFGNDGTTSSVAFRAEPGRYVVIDSTGYSTPPDAEPDTPSFLRTDLTGASYVIITDPIFAQHAEQLAEHRRSHGLTSVVVSVQDIYDEFSSGDLTEVAIQDFMRYAFENWAERPVYLLLFGRMSYDYRDLLDEVKNGRAGRIPAMPFQSVRRGQAFTDHFYGTVSGDDPLMDVWVGRVSVNNTSEATAVVSKIIGYDLASDDAWRSQATFLANWDAVSADALFISDSDRLIRENAVPLGLESHRIYHTASTPPEPNESSSETIRQLNEGRLLLNFMGHGSAASMQKFIAGTFQQRGFNYMSQITNGRKLPLAIAMSCLNGLYDEPTLICFAEEMVNKANGGSIGYVSASSLAFTFVNNEVNQSMLRYMMREGVTDFGPALGMSKNDLLAAMPGIDNGVVMMNLMGDPAQHLAIPSGPDYSVDGQAVRVVSDSDVLATSDTARVVVRVQNGGITTSDVLEILVLDRHLDTGQVDTIGLAELPGFGQQDSTAVLWPLAGLTGRHQIDVVLDPAARLTEIRVDNNRASVDAEIFGRLSAVALFPIASQEVTSTTTLGVRTGVTSEVSIVGEFELSRSTDFSGVVVRSGSIPADTGLLLWTAEGLEDGNWFWRARFSDGSGAGAWTQPLGFLVGDISPTRSVTWRQDASEALRLGESDGVVAYANGFLGRTTQPLPLKITAEFREQTIETDEVPATAVLATDGTFHYVKGFYSLPQIYPDSDSYVKVGSGLNGTTPGENLGPASAPEIPTVSATYHSDGFIYSDNRKAKELVRISPGTGETVTIPVEAGLLEIRSGLVFDGHSLITSDGNLIYNVANGINGIPRAGWSVRVFDPADWSIVREFTVDPTSTGFAFAFTDGILADGKYLYLIEFSSGASHRIRVVDAIDGTFVEEYQSDQEDSNLLSGQYDWVNNKVWFGQLNGSSILRYRGRRLPEEGVLTSAAIGPVTAWQSLSVDTSGPAGSTARVDLLGETAGNVFLPIAEWSDLAAGTIDLADLDPAIDRIKVRVRLAGSDLEPSAVLNTWAVQYIPVSDISISNLEVSATQAEELDPVRLSVEAVNRGPIDFALGAVVAFYAGDPASGRVIGRQALPGNTTIGVSRRVEFVWITARFPGTHQVNARVEDLAGNAAFYPSSLRAEALIQIDPSTDTEIPTVVIKSLDSNGMLRTGDYLPADTAFLITILDSSGVESESVEVLLRSVDSEQPTIGYGSNLVSHRDVRPTQLSFQYAPQTLTDGTHTIEVRVADRLGNGPATKQVSFDVTSDLSLENVLSYPNPMATETDFTFVLSLPSEVTIRVFTVSGRLIRILDERPGRAGYNQVHWDGLDSQGRSIANGTYLYTVTADDGDDRVKKKEALIVYR
jgi:hypothetical protein